MARKIWVRRPGSSATLVTIEDADLVDDVRDRILKKYANSLGRHFDPPDIALRLCPRHERPERILGPEELMSQVLEEIFHGGQSPDEAILIETHPGSDASTFFNNTHMTPSRLGPDMTQFSEPIVAPQLISASSQRGSIAASVNARTRLVRDKSERPRGSRNLASSSPVDMGLSSTSLSSSGVVPTTPPVPSGMRHHSGGVTIDPSSQTATPLQAGNGADSEAQNDMIDSPAPSSLLTNQRPRRIKRVMEPTALLSGLLTGGVPSINVLIVEDNPINLKLLEAFVRRLKVRWQTAMNGSEAVDKWRKGGFHLVLMDIHMPVMNGLQATREIRRLERSNSIGIYSSSSQRLVQDSDDGPAESDGLKNLSAFKSPVIIVALTASSLMSDRNDALAAGCNDFLSKPVNFVWLEKKIMEWGCMQALVDVDGWKKWTDAIPA